MQAPQTFRCCQKMKVDGVQVQCPAEMTLVNTFTYALKSLDRKAATLGKDKLNLNVISRHALCPEHARFLARVQKDIVRMDVLIDLFLRRKAQNKRIATEKAAPVLPMEHQVADTRFHGKGLQSFRTVLISVGAKPARQQSAR